MTLLAGEDPEVAQGAELRLLAGPSIEEVAQVLSVSCAHAYRQWAYARAWLQVRLRAQPDASRFFQQRLRQFRRRSRTY